MTRFGTLVTSTVVVALMSVADASGQGRGVFASGDQAIRSVAAALNGSVQGVVVDDGGRPVAGATVSALGYTSALAVTDRTGRFSLYSLPPGPYLIRAHVTGYIPSRRQFVEVRASARASVSVSVRRADRTRVMAAGVGGPGDGTEATDDHSEAAWRLRHLKRSVLKDAETHMVLGEQTEHDKQGGFVRAVATPARLASALFEDLPFTGQVNLLTTGSFDTVHRMFSSDTLSHGVASLSLRGPVGGWADWSLQGVTSQGDLGSWYVNGALRSHPSGSHAYDIHASYSAKRSNAGSGMLAVAPPDDNRAVGSLYAVDRWTISPQVTLTYAARYARYDYLGGGGFLSPRAELALRPTQSVELRASASRHVLAPGAEEFLPPLTVGLWVPTERTFNWLSRDSLHAERTNTYEFLIQHNLGAGYSLTARTFFQEVRNQLVALFGLNEEMLPASSYHAGNLGNLDARGWSVAFARGHRRLRASVAYQMTSAKWRDGVNTPLIAALAPSLIRRSERVHDVVAAVDTEVPRTETHLFVLYRIDSAFSRENADETRPGLDARFDIQVTQPLRLLDFTSAHWQLVFAVRNLFRESSTGGSVYDELLVVAPPKRMVGGVIVRF